MTEDTKAQLIDGSLDAGELDGAVAQVRSDRALAAELIRQIELNAALGVLLGSGAPDRRAVGLALRQLQYAAAQRPGRCSTVRHFFAALTATRVRLAAAAAAMFVLGGVSGMLGRHESTTGASSNDADPPQARVPSVVMPGAAQQRGPTGLVWLDRLSAATADQMDALFDAILAGTSGIERAQAIDWAVLRWAELDPHHAMVRLSERLPGERVWLGRLFDGWSRLDADAAWSGTSTIADAPSRRAAKAAVLGWLAQSDPPHFAKLASQREPATPAHWAVAVRAMVSSGRFGPEETRLLAKLDKADREAALDAAVNAMAGTDAMAAVNWARSLTDEDVQSTALLRAFAALAATDPEAAGKELAGTPNRRAIAGEIVQRLGRDDPKAALAWARRHGGDDVPALTRDLLVGLVRNADNRSIDVLADLVREGGAAVFRNDHRLDDIFWQARGLDFEKALGWVMNDAPRDAFGWKNIQDGMIFSWAKEDREAAARWITENVTEPGPREAARSAIVFEILSTTGDTRAAWDFNSARDPGPERGRLALEIVKRHAAVDPAAAAEWLKLLPPETGRAQAVESVASAWGAMAPDEAAEWAGALQAPDERVAAFRSIAGRWAEFDSWRASEWVIAQPPGLERDAAASALVDKVARFEGDSAFTWATTIQDPVLRQQALDAAARAWVRQDAAAVRAAIANPGLTTADRQQLEAILANPDAPAPNEKRPLSR